MKNKPPALVETGRTCCTTIVSQNVGRNKTAFSLMRVVRDVKFNIKFVPNHKYTHVHVHLHECALYIYVHVHVSTSHDAVAIKIVLL